MCPNEGVAPRNLYLELSGANFSISEWQIKRANKEYDNFDYSSAVSNTSSIKQCGCLVNDTSFLSFIEA